MKRPAAAILIAYFLMLAALFFSVAVHPDTIHSPKGFVGKLWNGTFALYSMEGNDAEFICTAEAIAKSRDGYTLLSAGHCVAEGGSFGVSEEVGTPVMPVTVTQAYLGSKNVDFSLLNFKTTKQYPIMSIGTDDDLRIGEPVLGVHFALGLGKQLSYGHIATKGLHPSVRCRAIDPCVDDFLVQDFAAPGASGSAVVSERSHKVIGILVAEFDGPVGFAIEPISNLAKVAENPTQFHAALDPVSAHDNPALRIPESVYQAEFGPEHPFMLTIHGPNPRFEQNGYTFVALVYGMELSDEYYYQVPVFIGEAEDGTFRLVSTKEGYSVDVAVVQAPEQK